MTEIPWLWWTARSTGLVAEVALTMTLLGGLGVAGALPWLPRRRAAALHEAWTISAILAAAVHAVAVAIDPRSPVPPVAVAVPFASPALRGAVALGTLALGGLAVVATSTVLRRHVGAAWWRLLHTLAWGTWVLGLAHGVLAGTDASRPVVVATHAALAAAVAAASTWRAVAPGGR
jgi:hypothetical protein